MARIPEEKAIIIVEIPHFKSKPDLKEREHIPEIKKYGFMEEFIRKMAAGEENKSEPFEIDKSKISEYADLLTRKRIEMFPGKSLNELINLNIELD